MKEPYGEDLASHTDVARSLRLAWEDGAVHLPRRGLSGFGATR